MIVPILRREFCGQVNRRKFGVPMGGFMSPGLAMLCCAMVELEMGLGPEGGIHLFRSGCRLVAYSYALLLTAH